MKFLSSCFLILFLLPLSGRGQNQPLRVWRQTFPIEVDITENRLTPLEAGQTERLDSEERAGLILIEKVTLVNGEIILDYNLPEKAQLPGAVFYRASLKILQDGQSLNPLPEYLIGTRQNIRPGADTRLVWSHLVPEYIDLQGQLELVVTLEEFVDCAQLEANLDAAAFQKKWYNIGFIAGGALSLAGGALILRSEATYNDYLEGETAEEVEDEYQNANDQLDAGVLLLGSGLVLLTADAIAFFVKKGKYRHQQRDRLLQYCPSYAIELTPLIQPSTAGFPVGAVGVTVTYTIPYASR